jgi:signal transduction histidine kinase
MIALLQSEAARYSISLHEDLANGLPKIIAVGLQPENVEQIFSAFFTSKSQGTGMGLSISRSIIESHGGLLWTTANRGPGATPEFVLPVKLCAHSVIQRAPSRT